MFLRKAETSFRFYTLPGTQRWYLFIFYNLDQNTWEIIPGGFVLVGEETIKELWICIYSLFILLSIQYSQNKNRFLSSKATSDVSFWQPEPNPSLREQILLWRKWSLKAFYFCHKKH